VGHSSADIATACCKAGPSSILGSAYYREDFPTEPTGDEEMERNLGEWRRMNLLYECDGMYVHALCKIIKIKQKRVASCHQTFK
jgi:hypothetical protein